MSARDVFISHEKSDGDVALDLAARLRARGFTTWCYEEDSIAGASYLVQIDRAIEGARSVIVIVSSHSLRSPHVRNEVVRAYESQKRFIPVRRGIEHEVLLQAQDDEDDERRREWRMAFGASVSLAWDAREPERVVERIVDGLRRLGVRPGEPTAPEVIAARPPVATPPATPPAAQPRSAPEWPRRDSGPGPAATGDPIVSAVQRAAQAVEDLQLARRAGMVEQALRAPGPRLASAVVVSVIGILVNAKVLMGQVNVMSNAYYYTVLGVARWIDLAGHGAQLWLNVVLVRTALRLTPAAAPEPVIRRLVDRQLALIVVWALASLFALFVVLGSNYSSVRGMYLGGVLFAAAVPGAAYYLLRRLFRENAAGTTAPGAPLAGARPAETSAAGAREVDGPASEPRASEPRAYEAPEMDTPSTGAPARGASTEGTPSRVEPPAPPSLAPRD